MPTEPAKMFPVGNGAGEDTSVKGGKRTRTGVAHRSIYILNYSVGSSRNDVTANLFYTDRF